MTTIETQQQQDIAFLRSILPDHYTVQPSKEGNTHVHCVSPKGLRIPPDGDDDEAWHYTMMAIRRHFGTRLYEVYHHTCSYYQNFTVYLRP